MSNVQRIMDVAVPGISLWRRGLRAFGASYRVRLMLMLTSGVFVLFTVQRMVLAGLCWRELADVPSGQLVRATGVAILYDLQITGYLTALLSPLILLPSNRALGRRWVRNVLAGGIGLALTLVFLLVLVDAAFFLYHSGNRLNGKVAEYMPNFGPVAETIWRSYPVILLALTVLAVLAGLCWAVRRVCFAGPGSAWPARARLICLAVLGGLVALCCRGGGKRGWVLDDDLAYLSRNNAVCQLSLNPTVSFGAAIVRYYWPPNDEDPRTWEFSMSAAEAFRRTRAALAGPGVTFTDDPTNPLWRTVQTDRPRRRPNVVIVVMEGFADRNVGALGFPASRTPVFDALAAQGTYFTNMYAVGPRTSRGLGAVLCGLPDVGMPAPITRPELQGRTWTLGREFRRRNYDTLFFYGGELSFDNMEAFFYSNGFDRMVGLKQMPETAWRGAWGVCDHFVFAEADRRFTAMAGDNTPFFAVVLTTTNHDPYDFPAGCIDGDTLEGEDESVKQANSIHYADWALGEFFRRARGKEYFANTVFVLVADHGQRPFDSRFQVDVQRYALPCLFYAPGLPDLVPRKHVDVLCSQTDIGPTLLGLLGGAYAHPMFGRDLLRLSPDDPGFALLRHQRRMACLRGDLILELPPGGQRFLYRHIAADGANGARAPLDVADHPAAVQEMDLLARALHHAAEELVRNSAYRQPDAP